MTVIDLGGTWRMTDDAGDYDVPIRLPGDTVTALVEAGHLPDPYASTNEEACRWPADSDWTLSRTVTVERTDYELDVHGLDCIAEIRINGQLVLETANVHRRYRVGLSRVLVPGENRLEIRLASPVRAAADAAKALPYPVPHSWNCPVPHGNLIRKAHCDFGWDWGPALMPSGLVGHLRLVALDRPRIRDILVHQHHEPGRVTLKITGHLSETPPDGTPVTVSICGETAEGRTEGATATAEITLDDPDLWWPAGLGPQALHELTLRVGDTEATRRIGLRSMELVSEPDAAGLSFGLRVNGRPVFARGSNWIPADALPGRITPGHTRALLQSAVDAGQNMIRVWGGGRYETEDFYDACDALGLMVWQDAMFACSLYPATEDFLAEVNREIRDVAARLQHRACLALWCGDNELVGALSWYEESKADRDRYLVAYDRLNRTIETALKAVDPRANWWPSSPSKGPLNFGDAWHQDGSGDMHVWSVWHEGADFDHYRDFAPRFCSEFGFQSYPSMPVIRRFAGDGPLNIASPVIEAHQKDPGGNKRIAETMFRYFRWPGGFADFVWLSQLQQGLAFKTAIDHWRQLKPHCQGTLYWQLNDVWPGATWATLDHGGGWRASHHLVTRAYASVNVVGVPDGDRLRLRAVNDGPVPVRITVTAGLMALDGKVRETTARTVEIPTDRAVDAGEIVLDDGVLPIWRWEGDATGEDLFAPQPWKTYDLPESGLRVAAAPEGDAWRLTLTAEAPAFFATVETETPGRFDRNALHVLPGRPQEITFTPESADTTPRFMVRDLQSSAATA